MILVVTQDKRHNNQSEHIFSELGSSNPKRPISRTQPKAIDLSSMLQAINPQTLFLFPRTLYCFRLSFNNIESGLFPAYFGPNRSPSGLVSVLPVPVTQIPFPGKIIGNSDVAF